MANYGGVEFEYSGKKKLDLRSLKTKAKGPGPNDKTSKGNSFEYFRVVANIKILYFNNPDDNTNFDLPVRVIVPYFKEDVDAVGGIDNLQLYKKVGRSWVVIGGMKLEGDANSGVGFFDLEKPFDPPSGWGER